MFCEADIALANMENKILRKFWNSIRRQDGKTADLLVFGAIGWDVDSSAVTEDILNLRNDGFEKLNLFINSPGGFVDDGMSIYNAVRMMDATVYVSGLAASIASVIAMAGNKVVMLPGSFLMIHNPWTFAIGDDADLKKAADVTEQMKNEIRGAYMSRTNMDEADVVAMMDAETWLNGEKAVEMGFANEYQKFGEQQTGDGYAGFVDMVAKAVQSRFGFNFLNFPKPKNEDDMRLSPDNLAKLNLPENATEEQVNEAIAALDLQAQNPAEPPEQDDSELAAQVQALANTVKTLQDTLAANADAALVAEVDAAVAAGKIFPKQKNAYVAYMHSDADACRAELASIAPNAVIPQNVQTPVEPAADDGKRNYTTAEVAEYLRSQGRGRE